MPGIWLALAYVAIFLYVVRRAPFFQVPGIRRRWLAGFFLLKVMAGVALWWIYTYHYPDRSTADIYKYFDDGAVMFSALRDHPMDYFRMLCGVGNDNAWFNEHYYHVMNNWVRKYEGNLANDSHTMIRFNALVQLFSFGHFHVHTVFAAFLSFTGMTAICKAFATKLPGREKMLGIAVYLIPSVLFWASGVIKESLLFFGLGLLVWKLFAWMDRRPKWTDLAVILFCLVLMFYLKFYVLVSMVPGLFALWWCRLRPGRTWLKYIAVHAACVVLALNVHHLIPGFNMLEVLWWKHNDFIGLATSLESGSYVRPPPLEPTFWSFVANAPFALYMTFLSPIATWSQGAFGKIAALETLALCLAPLLFLIHRRRHVDLPLVLFCLSFALLLALVIGWTTPVIGAIVRYRVPLLPFLLIAPLLFTDDERLLVRWPWLRPLFR